MNPQYPVYIISKGRWETRKTAKALDAMGVSFRMVVEPQEAENYAAVIGRERLLILPFSNLGQGSIPARNWVWEHSLSERHDWHWIMDDNIQGFFRLHRNLKTPVADGTILRCAEDFSERYANLAQSGLNYFMFATRKAVVPPYYLNTRIYSCILLRNDTGFRWRGRYNEDTDLSLRMLKAGWCTVLFNAFLACKTVTMSMKGGNTDELYRQTKDFDGRLAMAQSLRQQHPDVTKIAWKWGRWQHSVDYSGFRQRLVLKRGVVVPEVADNYGMILERKQDGEWRRTHQDPICETTGKAWSETEAR
jgi:hypothetical protein